MNKRVVMITAAVMTVAVPASANWAVYDYANLMEAKRLFDQAKYQVEHFKRQAMFLRGKRKFSTVFMGAWKSFSTPQAAQDSRLGKWLGAVNARLDAIEAWDTAVYRTVAYGDLKVIPELMRERRERELDDIELKDGTGADALDTIGFVRSESVEVAAAMRELEIATASEDEAMNTEAAQLNLANLYAAQQVKAQNANNRLATATAQIALQEMKEKREMAVQALSTEVRFRREAPQASKLVFGGESEAMRLGAAIFR